MSVEEIPFNAWYESKWFKGAARTLAWVTGIFLPIFTAALGYQLARMNTFETALAKVLTTQNERADIADDRELVGANFRTEVRNDIDAIDSKIDVLGDDVATIKGSLEVLLRQLTPRAPMVSERQQ